ncbi:hypothetical protein [Mesomycoplasma ovipneumoniae]|uniref:hypothetical protein n=1 Tax=Mesomycoplasma ovipneumoniae TaxID=29562 RepID=UPI0024ACEBD6|nr:hypothetical protein [Mesomycoplasma ovipneumoniae]WHF53741.1 hypothetical protein QJQ40_01340 [Mesomycoplasma ovipneumoniae]
MPKHNILFNVYGQPINEHPVVIWYSDNDDMYYFVKARRASKNGILMDKLPTEILIPASATKSDSLFLMIVYLIVHKFLECAQKILKSLMEEVIIQKLTNCLLIMQCKLLIK